MCGTAVLFDDLLPISGGCVRATCTSSLLLGAVLFIVAGWLVFGAFQNVTDQRIIIL